MMKTSFEESAEQAAGATGESATVDFKASFDPGAKGEWCELIKDVVAMANSGGGCIVFGVGDDGQPTALDCTAILAIDPATITDKIHAYTGKHFAEFRVVAMMRDSFRFGVLLIRSTPIPLVFTQPGTYPTGADNKQKTAFSVGTVYFRHGAKSQPGTSDDLEAFLKREIEAFREIWLSRLRQVAEAPFDAKISVLPAEGVRLDPTAPTAIRITTDVATPAYRLADPSLIHLFRGKEVIQMVNAALGDNFLNPHTLLCIRRLHDIDSNTEFSYLGLYSSRTYSQAFVDWLIGRLRENSLFAYECAAQWKSREKARRTN